MPTPLTSAQSQAQAKAQAIAPGRQPTEPYNGWSSIKDQKAIAAFTERGWDKDRFNASTPEAARARAAAAKYIIRPDSFKTNTYLAQQIPLVGDVAPPQPLTPLTGQQANNASYLGHLAGTGLVMGAGGGLASFPFAQTMKNPKTPPVIPDSELKPKAPMGAVANQGLKKKSSAMTDKQMFKVAFLSKCIEHGMTLNEIHLRVKQALHFAEKRASGIDAAVELIKTLPTVALAGLGLAGGGSYYLGNKVVGPGIHEAIKPPIPDKDDMMREELINEYDRQSELIRRQSELVRRKKLRDMNISGVTRY